MELKRRTTSEALDILEPVLSCIQHEDRALLSAPELVVLMGRVRRFSDQAVALASVVTDEVAQRQAATTATGTPLTSLIGIDEGRDSHDATKEVFAARDVNTHTTLRDLALAGKLSPRHAAAITKGLATLPHHLTPQQKHQAEEAFIRRAPKNTDKHLAQLGPEVLAEIAPDLMPDTADDDTALVAQQRRARAKRSLTWGDDGDGSMWFRGTLPHLQAAPLIAVVQAYVESDRRAERNRYTSTSATKPHPRIIQTQVTEDNLRTPHQRRADALTTLITDHRGAPDTIGDRPRIVVTIRQEDLRETAEKAGVLPTGAKITAGDLRRLCCDADLMPAVLGTHSEILDVGRTRRLVTPAIRKALTLRDGGCIFPGCAQLDTRCEAHHLTPWTAGGATALSNLVLLCPHHHKLVEPDRYARPSDKWRIHIHPHTGHPIITPPTRTERFIGRDPDGDPRRKRSCLGSPPTGSPPTEPPLSGLLSPAATVTRQ